MKRIKRYNESNGPAYGKEETTKRGLKGIPLTTDNPMIIDIETPEMDDEDTSFNDEDIEIEMEEPKPEIDKNNKPIKMRRTKKFEEIHENIGPASDSEFVTREDVKKQGEPLIEKGKLFEPHLKELYGKTIEYVDQDKHPITKLYFTDGTYLELTPFKNEWGPALQLRIKK